MCTLIARVPGHPAEPLVIAANRDEALDRPSRPPFLWPASEGGFVAPLDEQGGGTWLGISRGRMFVGITNRMGLPVFADRVSRGTLVTWALRQASAAALHEALQALRGDRHNPFHLFYADATGAFVTGSDGFRVWHRSLAPGLHVVTQQDVDSTGGRFDIVAEAMRRREPWDVPQLETLLREHREDPREAICVHAPGGVR
jgi:uncharacterized protein with NRDE domain